MPVERISTLRSQLTSSAHISEIEIIVNMVRNPNQWIQHEVQRRFSSTPMMEGTMVLLQRGWSSPIFPVSFMEFVIGTYSPWYPFLSIVQAYHRLRPCRLGFRLRPCSFRSPHCHQPLRRGKVSRDDVFWVMNVDWLDPYVSPFVSLLVPFIATADTTERCGTTPPRMKCTPLWTQTPLVAPTTSTLSRPGVETVLMRPETTLVNSGTRTLSVEKSTSPRWCSSVVRPRHVPPAQRLETALVPLDAETK